MSKLAIIGLVTAVLGLPVSASGGHVRHHYVCSSRSEMVSCVSQGVKGNRTQFVAALTRPAEHRAFLTQLAH
jgi:hypothetical protein